MPSPTMGPVIRRMWDQSLTIKGNLSNHNVRFAPHRHDPICLNASGSLGSFTVLCTSTLGQPNRPAGVREEQRLAGSRLINTTNAALADLCDTKTLSLRLPLLSPHSPSVLSSDSSSVSASISFSGSSSISFSLSLGLFDGMSAIL